MLNNKRSTKIEQAPPALLVRLCEIDKLAASRFPGTTGLGELGLGLGDEPTLTVGEYWCTPRNTLRFARNCGEGDFFRFFAKGWGEDG